MVSLVLALVQLISSAVGFLRDKNLMTSAEANLLSETLKEQINVITAAEKARTKARNANSAVDAGSSLPDDGYRRD
jgi:hypothetical protein